VERFTTKESNDENHPNIKQTDSSISIQRRMKVPSVPVKITNNNLPSPNKPHRETNMMTASAVAKTIPDYPQQQFFRMISNPNDTVDSRAWPKMPIKHQV
jgi:hypothetical protein